MATKDDGGQARAQRGRQAEQDTVEETSSDVAERHEKLADDVDSILDEIDEVLESNSEEFVRSFVQKGGE